jgi:hypothetical protein
VGAAIAGAISKSVAMRQQVQTFLEGVKNA